VVDCDALSTSVAEARISSSVFLQQLDVDE